MTEIIYANKAEIVQQLSASVGASDDKFGACLAIDGDWLAIGAPLADPAAGSAAGRVFIFQKSGGTWSQTQIIEGTVAGDEFGCQVALSGDKLAVGWLKSDSIAAGAGSVYTYTLSGGTWVFESELVPGTSIAGIGGTYGSRLHMDGDVVIVGMPSALSGQTGKVFAFHWSGSAWVEKTVPAPATVGSNDQFGCSVAVSESAMRFVAGAHDDDDGATDSGAAYVYEFDVPTDSWVEVQKLKAVTDGPAYQDYFGLSVGISADGTVIAVGAYGYDDPVASSGAIYVFEQSLGTWTESTLLTQSTTVASNVGARIGFCQTGTAWDTDGQKRLVLTDDGSTVICGSVRSYELTTGAGAIHYWTRGASWSAAHTAHTIYPDIKQGNFHLGAGVALDGSDTFIFSILDDDGVATDSGTVYVVEEMPWAGATDTTAPVVTVVSPAAGSTIDYDDTLTIDVTDETSLLEVILMAKYASSSIDRATEVIWDGSAFMFPFENSTRTVITNGHRYAINRTRGWQSSPTVDVRAIDTGGNEAT